jgi:hypothetical protein
MSQSMKVSEENGELVIRVPMNKNPQPSASGKTLIVATSNGNQPTTVQVNGKPVTVGFNAYVKR